MKGKNYNIIPKLFTLTILSISINTHAIKTAAALEPYLFHQSGDYSIASVGDSGDISISGVGARIGGLFGVLYIGAEGQVGITNMETSLSPDTINRDVNPLAKTYDAIGGTLGIVVGRLQLYGTYFFDEKLNYTKKIEAEGSSPAQEYTYNYMGEGMKFTLGYNISKSLSFGFAYHKATFDRYREKYEPESVSNKTTRFLPRNDLDIETFEFYLSWKFGSDKFVTVK